jgi:ketosteroid isomerase-like protein
MPVPRFVRARTRLSSASGPQTALFVAEHKPRAALLLVVHPGTARRVTRRCCCCLAAAASRAAVGIVDAMQVPPAIEAFVDRVSAGDGDAAAELVHDDAEFELPGNKSLPIGSAGARAFASRHGEVEGRLISVELKSAEAVRENCWVARLLFVNREIASGETMYEMEVGGLFELRHDRVARFRAFPSPEEAVAAAALGGPDG